MKPLPDSATCYFRFLRPTHFPVRGDTGEYLAVWALPLNLWVLDMTGEWVIRRASFDEGKLWTALDALIADGSIAFLDHDELLRRPLPTVDVPSRPALRVIRAV